MKAGSVTWRSRISRCRIPFASAASVPGIGARLSITHSIIGFPAPVGLGVEARLFIHDNSPEPEVNVDTMTYPAKDGHIAFSCLQAPRYWAEACALLLGLATQVLWVAIGAGLQLGLDRVGVMEIVVAMHMRRELRHEWLLILSGALSLGFAVLLVITPGAGALGITWLIAWYAILDPGQFTFDPGQRLTGTLQNNAATLTLNDTLGNLDASFGYSDSFSDYPMLAVVGRPTAINPDLRLRAIARSAPPVQSAEVVLKTPDAGVDALYFVSTRVFTDPQSTIETARRATGGTRSSITNSPRRRIASVNLS